MPITDIQVDKIRGVIYGQAIGDALGLATEFMSKTEVLKAYPEGVKSYADIQEDEHTNRWEKGDWTDDTDQMLCILDAILEYKELSLTGVCQNFMSWFHGEPLGIGNTVYSVLNDPQFLIDPQGVSKKVWEESERQSAANGGVMRTSILGVWDFTDKEKVIQNAKDICTVTHYDPRCVASCVAISLAISLLLMGSEKPPSIVAACISQASQFATGIVDQLENIPKQIEELMLDEYDSIGYTFKATQAGFWALAYAESFLHGIQSVIMEGGDADTNAAVAGAVLGAKFGYNGIPAPLIEGLVHRKDLDDKIQALLALMLERA